MRLALATAAALPLVLSAACVPATPSPSHLLTAADTAAYAASISAAERRSRKIRIHESYDRFTGRTVVSVPLLDDGAFSSSDARLVVSFSYPGDTMPVEPTTEVLFAVDWEEFGSIEYLDPPSADFLVDDSVRFSAKGRDYRRYVDRSFLQIVVDDSTLRQRVTIPVAREDFARITRSSKVEARLTSGAGFVLKPEHIVALRRLEERMR